MLGKLFDGICLEGPAALIAHFERLRQRLKRYAGQHDGVERQHGTLVNQIIDHGLVEDRVEHAARARHGIVDVDKHSAARLIEEALAFMIDPEPRLSQCAAALLEFVGARELVDRRNVRKIRCIAGNGVHAGNVGADQASHRDAVAGASVHYRPAEPNWFDHAERRGVRYVLCEHFLIGSKAAGGDDHLLGMQNNGVALGISGFNTSDLAVVHDETLR